MRLLGLLFVMAVITNAANGQKCYFVSPTGNDWNDGAPSSLFKTPEAARDKIRKYKEQSGLPAGGFVVYLREGLYELSGSFLLDGRDGGEKDKKIVYKAYQNEKVILSGGKLLSHKRFGTVRDPAIVKRLHANARGKVLQYSLKDDGAFNYGDYHTKPPNGVEERPYDPALMLFVNGNQLPVARFPNKGWIRLGRIIDQGAVSKINGFRQVLDTANRGGVFEFDFPEAARWVHAKDIWLSGWFHWGWYADEVKVADMNLEKRQFTLASALRYGLGPTDDTSLIRLERRKYFVFNLLEEIDEPGEWYLNRDSGLLYLWPTGDFNDAEIAVSVLNAPLIKGDSVSFVDFEGFTFCYGKKQAIEIRGGSGNQIRDCIFRNLGNNAIVLSGNDLRVSGCEIFNTRGGMAVSGGDRRTLTPSNNIISNCNIHHITGRAIHLEGVGTTVEHNEIYQSNAGAVGFSGNDHLIIYNRFDHLYNEGGDDLNVLGIGRNPSNYGSVIKFNIFSNIGLEPNNVSSVYLDDGSCGTTIYGNIFYKASSRQIGTVFSNGGSDNTVMNNIFIDNNVGYYLGNCFHTWASERIKDWLAPDGDFTTQLTREINIRDPVWAKAYPKLANYFEDDPATPKRNIFSGNVVINTKQAFRGDKAEPNVQEVLAQLETGNYIARSLPGLVDWEAKKINISKDSPIRKVIPDFEMIPMEKIGNY